MELVNQLVGIDIQLVVDVENMNLNTSCSKKRGIKIKPIKQPVATYNITILVDNSNKMQIDSYLQGKDTVNVIVGGPYLAPINDKYFSACFKSLLPYARETGCLITFRFEKQAEALLFKLTFG
jgi:hypothetical protein